MKIKKFTYFSMMLVLLASFAVSQPGLAAVSAAPASPGNAHPVCPGPVSTGNAHCGAWVKPNASSSPTGLDPATMKAVYNFPVSLDAGAGQTIAIVDAYDLPTAESDLNTFSAAFGLPSCTTANGCFTKVDQTGGTNYPRSDAGWGLEIALDIEWAHAIAPGAHILLVEASSASFANLLAAEDYASLHAGYVSNSWGGNEFSGENAYDSHFKKSGVSYFVSSGDAGLPAEYPSASPNVISVGGTTLTFNSDGTLKSETGWSSGGGGCSQYESADSAQAAFSGYSQVNCAGKRATPDVSLDADPNSGASVYDSTKYYGQSGWWQVGGTSLSSPMWAARSAVLGSPVNASLVYGSTISFRDITVGNNGAPCLVGFDLCTGRGSWLDPSTSPSQYTLTVDMSGTGSGTVTDATNGINCTSSTCSYLVDAGTSLSLTATSDTGSTFTGWGGVCSGTGACSVTMNSSQTVIAGFDTVSQSQYTLTVNKTGTGTGSVTSSPIGIDCGSTCSAAFDANSSVSLAAVADPGSSFTGWSGSVCSGTGTCTVTMTSALTVTAVFDSNSVVCYTLTTDVSPTGSGSVTVDTDPNCGSAYTAGTVVTLTAVPANGYTFRNWTGSLGGSQATVSFAMTADVSATANFKKAHK